MKAKWGDSYTKFINRIIKIHDDKLYAERDSDGVVRVFRRGKRYVPFFEDGNVVYQTLVDSPHFVFALTDSWKSNGKPVDWGSEVILSRLRFNDLWSNEGLFDKLDKDSERMSESKKRDFMNSAEDFLSDQHSHIKKSWGDIRVANMDKTERRRRQFEKNKEIKEK